MHPFEHAADPLAKALALVTFGFDSPEPVRSESLISALDIIEKECSESQYLDLVGQSARRTRSTRIQAAVTASCHMFKADARKARCVLAEMR